MNILLEFYNDLLLHDFNFKKYEELYVNTLYMLEFFCGVSEKDARHLDFDVKFGCDNNDIKIIANNILTALWFSGVFPNNPTECLNKNKCVNNDLVYGFDKKQKKLLISSLNKNE